MTRPKPDAWANPRRPQRRIDDVLIEYAELRRAYPGRRDAELAPMLRMTPTGLSRALQRARAKARAERGSSSDGGSGSTD